EELPRFDNLHTLLKLWHQIYRKNRSDAFFHLKSCINSDSNASVLMKNARFYIGQCSSKTRDYPLTWASNL
ncbi:MAG: hypothetical protein ACYTXY_13800, partial [Nostoc sp.]